MDSEVDAPTHCDHEAAPPSYNETISPSFSNLFPYSASSASQYYSAQIQDQLRSLTAQIRSAQTQRSLLTHDNDEQILTLLATEIQIFFSGFTNSGLQRGTLILVPSGAVQEGATPMEYDFRDPEEYDRVLRVRNKEEKESGEWFWRDEEMARRLARYLSPTPSWNQLPSRRDDGSEDNEPMPAVRKAFVKRTQQTPVEVMQKQNKGFFGFRKRGTITSIERPPVAQERDLKINPDVKVADASPDDQAALSVRAEEVSFRMENEMGLFESRRGWALVLKLNVDLGRL